MALPRKAAHTVVQITGAVAWVFGLIFLFLFLPLGVFLLVVASVLSIVSLTWTRQARHDEVVGAAGGLWSSPVQLRYQGLHFEYPDRSPKKLWKQAKIDVRDGWRPAVPLEKSTADRLVKLDALRAAGAISDDGYEAQRAQILRESDGWG